MLESDLRYDYFCECSWFAQNIKNIIKVEAYHNTCHVYNKLSSHHLTLKKVFHTFLLLGYHTSMCVRHFDGAKNISHAKRYEEKFHNRHKNLWSEFRACKNLYIPRKTLNRFQFTFLLRLEMFHFKICRHIFFVPFFSSLTSAGENKIFKLATQLFF